MTNIRKFLISLLSLFSLPLFATQGTVKSNNVDIWYETFGKKEDPALLLIMGACCQSVIWPEELCEKLVKAGFYVIRYDHRDAGYSTCFDYEKDPYDLLDMAKDAKGLLDALKIEKAHLFGLSTGGPIAEILSVHFPEKVATLTMMATSCDFRPSSLAYDGLPAEKGSLSRPLDIYLAWMDGFTKNAPKNHEEMLAQRIEGWRILSGFKVPFDVEMNRKIHEQFLSRLRSPSTVVNHLLAIKRSEELIRNIPSQVKVPTLILHGSEDAIFPKDHGDALAKRIPHAKYLLVDGMGHVPSSHFFDLMADEIKELAKKN